MRGFRGSRRLCRPFLAALPRQRHDARQAAAAVARRAMTRKQQRLGLLALGMAALGRRDRLGADRVQRQSRLLLQPERSEGQSTSRRTAGCGSAVWSRRTASRAEPTGAAFRSHHRRSRPTSRSSIRACCRTLFREGQGAVAEGKLRPTGLCRIRACSPSMTRDYMPREVVDALKKSGHWQEEAAAHRSRRRSRGEAGLAEAGG